MIVLPSTGTPSSSCTSARTGGNGKAWSSLPSPWLSAGPPCLYRSHPCLQTLFLFMQIRCCYVDETLFMQIGPCLPRSCPCLLNSYPVYADYIPVCTDYVPVCRPRPCLLRPCLTQSCLVYPGLIPKGQKPRSFAESQLPGTSSRPEGWFLFAWLAPALTGAGLTLSQGPAVEGRCGKPPAQNPAKAAPSSPKAVVLPLTSTKRSTTCS